MGIDLLKDFATDVVKVIKKFSEAKEDDGKVSTMEWVGLVPSAGAVAKDLVKYPELIAQVKDIDSSEGKELIAHIVSMGIVGKKAEVVAYNIVEIIEKEIDVWDNNIVPIIAVFK